MSTDTSAQKSVGLLSVVVPLYNEEEVIHDFFALLDAQLKTLAVKKYEIIFVNDGSSDRSAEFVQALVKKHAYVKSVQFTKNFGKEAALSAGLHVADGDAVLLIDADGQHPPQKIPELLASYRQGHAMVIGVRSNNEDEKRVKKMGNLLYYRLLRMAGIPHLQPGITDFRIIGREVVDEFCALPERRRITRGLLDWLGYDTAYVTFESPSRLAGEASYNTKKLAYLAVDSILSNSRKPLVFSLALGVLMSMFGLLGALFIVIEKYIFNDPFGFTGVSFLVLMVIFLIGTVMIGQGIASLYLARIYEEAQRRPLYVINRSKSKL